MCILLLVAAAPAQDTTAVQDSTKVRKGWTFGVLPSFAYDADLGLQLGLLTNIYYFGDGKTYPEYLHSFYAEAATTSKHYGLFRLSYDSKYLIPNHRLSVDISYLPDQMCDFYGFNGVGIFDANKMTSGAEGYLTRAYYKQKRDFFRASTDLQGTISKPLYWNVGLGLLWYNIGPVDVDRLNSFTSNESKKLPSGVETLYDHYVKMGYIQSDETGAGAHPYLHAGVTLDTRDRQQNPRKGYHADAFFTYYAGMGDKSRFNNLKFNAAWRHYVAIVPQWLTFAYRVGTQLNVAGDCPFYLNNYINQLYMQRVIYEGLGGANSVRGIMRNRILAQGVAYANVEFRVQVAQFMIGKEHFYIGLNPFVDAGMVVQPYKFDNEQENIRLYGDEGKITPDKIAPHFSGGCGLKIAMNDNFVLSVDWAMPFNPQDNNKNTNFYIKMGYMF